MTDRDPVQEAAKQVEAAIHKAAEDALVNGTGTIRSTDLGVEYVPPEQFQQRRDPVQEAVERAVMARFKAVSQRTDKWMLEVLAAALAPYGGLEAAIAKLEEGR